MEEDKTKQKNKQAKLMIVGIAIFVIGLAPVKGNQTDAIYGYIYGFGNSTNTIAPFYVRPVVYLNSNVAINDGTGEITNPYKLG